jgi:glycosyltransferase involved in cell wall biosynthesis
VPASRPDVSIVTSGHDVADARLHREVAALRRAGLEVEVIGLGDPASGPSGARVRTSPRPGMVGRGLSALVGPWRARGRVILVLDPELVVPARVRGALGRRRVIADVHEDYAALLSDRAWARGAKGSVARGLVAASTRAARGADLCVVADQHVPPLVADHRLVVRNLPDPSLLPEPLEPEPEPRAVYVGDVRGTRGLFAMLAALEAAPRWTLDVVGPVAGSDADAVERWRASSPASSRVRWHGRLDPARAWSVAAGAWVGLSLLAPTPAFLDAVPSKLSEYAGSGLAVIVTDLPRQRAWIEAAGSGAVVPTGSDTEVGATVAAVLEAWADDSEQVRHARAQAASVRAEPNDYDDLAAAVTALVQRG